MTITPKPQHVHDAEKMAEAIYKFGPIEQQQMLETIKTKLIELGNGHVKSLQEI
jgi:hypothetical protein